MKKGGQCWQTHVVLSLRLCRQRRTVDLRDLLAVSLEAAVLGGREVKKHVFSQLNEQMSCRLSSYRH